MQQIVIASNNAGKIREMQTTLYPLGYQVVSQRDAGVILDVEETGTTFAENAALKARALYEILHCPVIADDSGLMVDALEGAPGVYSHRFAGENATDAQRCEKLLQVMREVPQNLRTARFVCVLCYLDTEGQETFFTGNCEGMIGTVPQGENGFGYDPVFCWGSKTMAQMTEEEKNQISHRGDALRKLQEFLSATQRNGSQSDVNK